MDNDWNMIEVLRHARHDWLNKIQLIKGNLALDKIDRAKEIIDEIVVEAQQEAKLSNLKIPQFASLLLTYNWENHSFQLEYDVMDDSKCDKLDDGWLAKWTCSFFACLNSSVQLFYENHLSVTIESQMEGTRFFFDFSGIITNKEQIESFLKKESSKLKITIQEFTEQELAMEVFMPFNENGTKDDSHK